MFAALQTPDVDGPIIPATGEPLAIRVQLERPDRPLMGLSHPYTFPTLQVPPAQHAIAATTQQQRSARIPGQRMHDRVWLAQVVQAFPATRLPAEELPPATAPAATGQPRAIRTPVHARRQAPMLLQFREQRAVGGLPQAHAANIAAAGQARPVRTPRHLTYPGRGVCMTDPPAR